MRNVVYAILTAVIFLSAPLSFAESHERLPKDFSLKGLKEGKFKAKDLKKYNLTIVSFYADWCSNCSKTMYKLDKTAERYKGVRWVGLSVDEKIASAKDYFKHLPKKFKKLNKKAYFDKDAELASTVDIEALPAYIIVDKKGDVVHSGSGYPDRSEMNKIKKVLKNKKYTH